MRACLAVVTLVAFTAASLRALPARAEGEATEEAAKVRVTTFLLDHKGVDDALLVPGMRKLDDALRRNPRLEMKDLDTRLADFANEIPSDQVEEGRKQLAEGHKQLGSREWRAAVKTLQSAIDILSRMLPYIKKQELAEAMCGYGVALHEAGDRKGARQAFNRLLVWRGDHKYDTTKYPEKLLSLFEEVKKEVGKEKRGSVEIRSDPPAAQAYVDGRYVGVTPATAEGLVIGEHFVTLKREGFHKAVQPVMVSAKAQGAVEFKLERSAKFLLVEEALRAVEKQLGHDRLETDVDNLKEVLFLDHGVFVRAQRSSGGKIRVETFLYDLRSRRRLSTESHEIPDGDAEKLLTKQATSLYMNVKYDAELEAPAEEPVPIAKPAPKPIYKRWWFWTIIGGVAIAVGATTGVLVKQYKPQSCGGTGDPCFGFSF
jgi:hypothetical protein